MPIRWQDPVDIGLLTLALWRLHAWVRGTVAVQVALGVLTVVLGAWVAGHLGLVLTSAALSAVGAVLIIVVVVVFRDEIRRGLPRTSPLSWWVERGSGHRPSAFSPRMSSAVFALAADRVGVLLVLPRRDDLGVFLTGATPVDGLLTPALVEAIFTSTSPLHDGAAVIVGDRLSKAGAVLPLSVAPLPPSRGTRHRAALGLAEGSDAVVICVSEERGEVSVAADGQLWTVASPADLQERLVGLFDSRPPRSRGMQPAPSRSEIGVGRVGRPTRPRWLHDLPALVVILLGVLTAWRVTVLDDPPQEVARTAPLEIRGIHDDLAFEPPRQTSVVVELRGSRRQLEAALPGAVTAYVDLAHASAGRRTLPIAGVAPNGIAVVSVIPSEIDIEVLERRTLSVEPKLPEGSPPGETVLDVRPARVTLVGRPAAFRSLAALSTRPTPVRRPSAGQLVLELDVPEGLRLVDARQASVTVTIARPAASGRR